MNAATYRIVTRVIAFGLAALIAVSIVLEAPLYYPLAGVMAALVAERVCRSLVKETMTDERSHRIYEKATAVSYRIYALVTAAFALVALMLRSSLPSWAGIAGETLAYALCGFMLLHLAIYRYYGRKL